MRCMKIRGWRQYSHLLLKPKSVIAPIVKRIGEVQEAPPYKRHCWLLSWLVNNTRKVIFLPNIQNTRVEQDTRECCLKRKQELLSSSEPMSAKARVVLAKIGHRKDFFVEFDLSFVMNLQHWKLSLAIFNSKKAFLKERMYNWSPKKEKKNLVYELLPYIYLEVSRQGVDINKFSILCAFKTYLNDLSSMIFSWIYHTLTLFYSMSEETPLTTPLCVRVRKVR